MYPVLEFSSLQFRCLDDLARFAKKMGLPAPFIRLQHVNSLNDAQRAVNTIRKSFAFRGDYVDIISRLHPNVQNLYWQTRTLLFYQILVIVTNSLANETFFREMYGEGWRSDVAGQLPMFELGIFGSITPTSDIDVGLQFSGTLETPVLAYVVNAFETAFMKLTGKSTLKYDIEMYADMMTVKRDNQDVFYLTTTDFTEQHFLALLPIALLSMARNYCFATTAPTTLANLAMIQSLPPVCSAAETEWTQACNEMSAYVSMNYDDQRREYYRRVQAAEAQKIKSTSAETNLDIEQRVELMKLLGLALAYRQESYLLAPTIIHVVRVLQGEKNSYKYRTTVPTELCQDGPFCTLGYWGYVLSAMEQIGFLARFKIYYCEGDHRNETQCTKKLDKYLARFGDALFHINAMRPVHAPQGGRSRRKRPKSKRSRRHK